MKTNKNISLAEIGAELPFSVPENYFEQFALQIDEQIGYKQRSAHRFIRPWMYAAAMVIGIMVLSPVFYSVYQNKATANTENYESYVLSQVDETVLMDCYVDDSTK
ncbi:MAG TPA: hypothetical protein VI413_00180 [Paludibacter sp.]